MRAVLQRVLSASVIVDGEEISRISKGIAVLLGVGKDDTDADVSKMADKIAKLRIFEDENQRMNLSVQDIEGEILVVSQFTLYGDCKKGRRPGFDQAAPPKEADKLYKCFVEKLSEMGIPVQTGKFQAKMIYNIENDGPVTLMIDTKGKF